MKTFAKHKQLVFRMWSFPLMTFAIGTTMMSCQQEILSDSSSDLNTSQTQTYPVAARTAIGSTAPLTHIKTLAQLRAMSTSGNYILDNDIDASSTSGTPFVPIGYTKDPFHGTFNGNNKVINKLTINGSGNTGMFMWAVNAKLINIRLTNVNVTGGYSTGGLAGYVENVDLTNSYVTGVVTGNSQCVNIGLAIGEARNYTRIARCYTQGLVKGRGTHMGGFIGLAAFVGSIIDPNDDPRIMLDEIFVLDTISPTFPAGSSTVNAGGIIGTLKGGNINNVNSVCVVKGRKAAGGLIGNIVNDDPSSVASYIRGGLSRGEVTDVANAGRTGAIGMMTGNLSWTGGAYYDKDTDTGIPNPSISDPSCQVGYTSNQLKSPHGDPNKLLTPYIFGMLLTQQVINQYGFNQCQLNSGSDGDWGFGTCGQTALWALNSSSQYNTLLRIPNPGVQPK